MQFEIIKSGINTFFDYVYYPFVKYRIHISLIFFFLLINVFNLQSAGNYSWPVIVSFSLWHFALYIFDRAYDYKLDAINQPKEAIIPAERNFFLWLSIIACLSPLVILPYYGLNVWPYLPFIPVTFLYTFPLYRGIRSKNIFLFKNLYSALFIWTLPLAVIAYYYTDTNATLFELFKGQFLGLFIYVMVGEAFWDIRDMDGDKELKVYTIPVVLGVLFTKIYLILLILTDLFIFGKDVRDSTIIYIILIIFLHPKSPRWLFHIPALLALYRFLKPIFLT